MAEIFLVILIGFPLLIITTAFYHLSQSRNPYFVITCIMAFSFVLFILANFYLAFVIFVGSFFMPYKKDYKPKKSSFDDEFIKENYTDEKS